MDNLFVEDDALFTRVYHHDPLTFLPRTDGKFVFHHHPKHLYDIVFFRLRSFISQGTIPYVKFRRVYNDLCGPFKHLLPPLCVYSTLEDYDETKKILHDEGLRMIYWQSNEATERLRQTLRLQ